MPKTIRLTQIGFKIETTEGTAESLANADANMLVVDPDVDFGGIEMNERNPVSASMSHYPDVTGKQSGTITFAIEVRGSGTAATAPSWGKALRCCGAGETVTTVVDYAPVSALTSIPSATIGFYRDGVRFLFAGCRGTATLSLDTGGIAMLNFSFQGKLVSHTDTALLAPTYETTIPPAFLSAALTIHALAMKIKTFDLDLAAAVAARTDPTESTGIISFLVTGRRPTLKIDPELETIAAHDFLTKLKANTTGAVTLTLGTTAGNKIVITAPAFQYGKIDLADRESIAIHTIEGGLQRSAAAGDDEWKISHQ